MAVRIVFPVSRPGTLVGTLRGIFRARTLPY
jgi:hypothetical protein